MERKYRLLVTPKEAKVGGTGSLLQLGWDYYEELYLIGYTQKGEYILRDKHGDIHFLFMPPGFSEYYWLEIRCDRCGGFDRDVAPGAGGWTCFALNNDHACQDMRLIPRARRRARKHKRDRRDSS